MLPIQEALDYRDQLFVRPLFSTTAIIDTTTVNMFCDTDKTVSEADKVH